MSSPSPSKEHIATFHTHFGALSFHKKLKALGDGAVLAGGERLVFSTAVMMPVPRKLSASCGTCVKFFLPFDPAWADEDLDGVYLREGETYQLLFENEET